MAQDTEELSASIVENINGDEVSINLAQVRFCIGIQKLQDFKSELEMIIEKYRI